MKRLLKGLAARASSWCCGLALVLALPACQSAGNYVWVNEVPAAVTSGEYRIHAGDLVSVIVFQQDAMSTKGVRVRSDGKIALPILGDVDVRGQRPADVKAYLEGRLKEFVVTPHVTVGIEEASPVEISVLGEVIRAGNFTLKANAGLPQALAFAGGLTDFANRDRIFVVRPPKRIRFTYQDIVRGEGRTGTFVLEPGDVIVVE